MTYKIGTSKLTEFCAAKVARPTDFDRWRLADCEMLNLMLIARY